MVAHILLQITPFLVGFAIAAVTTGTISAVAAFGGLGLSWLISGPLKYKTVVWTAFLIRIAFPKTTDSQ